MVIIYFILCIFVCIANCLELHMEEKRLIHILHNKDFPATPFPCSLVIATKCCFWGTEPVWMRDSECQTNISETQVRIPTCTMEALWVTLGQSQSLSLAYSTGLL